MYDRPSERVRPGQAQLSAREFNRMLDRLDATDIAGAGMTSSDEFGQNLLTPNATPRTNIRILEGTNPYAWEEVAQLADGTWQATGVLSGQIDPDFHPAYERNGNESVAEDTVHEAVQALDDEGVPRWQFTAGGGEAGFWAKITSYNDTSSPTKYGFIEQNLATGGTWTDGDPEEGARSGSCGAWVRICEVTAGDGSAVNEQQSIAIIGATSGTFTLTYSGQTTSALNWNCSAGDIDAALEALSNLTSVSVTGSGTIASPFVVTFLDNFTNLSLMTATYSSLQPAADKPAYEANSRVVAVNEIVWMRPGFDDPEDYRFKHDALPSGALSATVVTDVTWDEETCEMTKTTKTLAELISEAARCP